METKGNKKMENELELELTIYNLLNVLSAFNDKSLRNAMGKFIKAKIKESDDKLEKIEKQIKGEN